MDKIIDLDLEAMQNVDIRTVEPTILADIKNTKIDPDKPLPERMIDFIKQVRNPYCFRCGKMIIKLSYADTTVTFEERMEGFFRVLQNKHNNGMEILL